MSNTHFFKYTFPCLLGLASIEHAGVDEVGTHNGGLDAIFAGGDELQGNGFGKAHSAKLTGAVVCDGEEDTG